MIIITTDTTCLNKFDLVKNNHYINEEFEKIYTHRYMF